MQAAVINQLTFKVPWETSLGPGPVGEYLEVIDFDPPSDICYEPVDLNDPHLLAADGLPPSDGNPQFHQQMVYAVAMTTIRNFERALGRRALWSPRKFDAERADDERYVPRLRIYPHAMREANAYYSPEKKALLFGYFPASATDPGNGLPGGMVFTCLSHDIIAHETTHALLDGIHGRFTEPSNQDVLAFHEAFADIVALFQHFSFPDVLKHQIARTRGNLTDENLLGQLAQEFGQAVGNYGALRDAIGRTDPQTGKWRRTEPDATALDRTFEPHDRGAILVAAVFDAFLSIYQSRTEDLMRLASNGTGILAAGAIHPDLVNRLAAEAGKSAQHVLNICIRALDYCPTVDLTFGEYLRALITADYDLVRDDDRGYRIAFIEGFRRRGIYPSDVKTLSVESLRWQPPDDDDTHGAIKYTFERLARWEKDQKLQEFIMNWHVNSDRKLAFDHTEKLGGLIHEAIEVVRKKDDVVLGGLDPNLPFQIHSIRPTRRVGPDGEFISELVIEIAQRRLESFDDERQRNNEGMFTDRATKRKYDFVFRGGSTLIINLDNWEARYNIVKSMASKSRLQRQRDYLGGIGSQTLHATYFGGGRRSEPFAALHREL
jgi:hypothetical protein